MKTWRDIPGYFDYADFYRWVVSNAPAESMFVEVGVWQGRSLAYLAELVRDSGKAISLHGVDWFKEHSLKEVGGSIADCGLSEWVRLLKGTSVEASKWFEDGSLDFVFLDADHTYEGVTDDITVWLPKMKRGSIMAGHDRVREGVDRAVRDAFGKYEVFGELVWWVRV